MKKEGLKLRRRKLTIVVSHALQRLITERKGKGLRISLNVCYAIKLILVVGKKDINLRLIVVTALNLIGRIA